MKRKQPPTSESLARQVAKHFRRIDLRHDRLFVRIDGKAHEVDFNVQNDVRTLLASRRLTRCQLLRVGIFAGAYHLAQHVQSVAKKGGV